MADLAVVQLRCEYLVNPLGLDEPAPRLSWRLESDRRGARQTAYRIRVARSHEALAAGAADRWDSGRVAGDQTTQIVYAGAPLSSRDQCHWCVEAWDETGQSAVSPPAFWTMGLLTPSDWSARWIAAHPEIYRRDPEAIAPTLTDCGTPGLFRKEFEVPGPVQRATLYATARGLFELRINGRRVGDDVFAPEWTDYDKRLHYRTYDVTAMLRPGRNALGAVLGDGWWSGYVGWQETRARYGSLENSLLAQLEIELAGGQRLTLNTDHSWTCHTGPIRFSDFMMGETYDARREIPGWDAPGLAENAVTRHPSPVTIPWLPVREVPPPGVPLVAQRSEPVRVVERLAPVAVRELRPGVFLYDLGQNIAGWVRLTVNAPAGTRFTLRHGERLNPDGTLYTENLRRAKATDVFIAHGGGEEVFEPHFTFHGFQHVELTVQPPAEVGGDGSGGLARLIRSVEGCVVRSALEQTGWFECSHPGVNRLWLNSLWSQKDNFLSVPTDCPQRDERLGWTGDAQVFLRTASYNMDVAAFFTKWMVDVADAQTAEGVFPDTAPRLREGENFVGLDGLGGAAGWADAGIIIPHTLWQVYGDRRIVERHWGAMVKWLDWIERHNPDGLRVHELGNNYGDWLCLPSDTSFRTHSPMKNLLATAFWADDAAKMAGLARVLGRGEEAARFQAMFEKVRAAFQREWLRADGRLTVETQTAYVLALAFDLLPPEVRAPAAARLVELIAAQDWHLNTGFLGIRHLNPQLTLTGHHDVACRLLLQETYPSWLYPVRHGATTIWERWNGWTEADGFFNPQMNSFNHYSLGSVGEWLFRHLAGIELDPEHPGFQRFVLRPFPCARLEFVHARHRTHHGEIRSAWRRAGRSFEWAIRIPANTAARVFVPTAANASVTVAGVPVEQAPGLRVLGREGQFLACEAEAGQYEFVSTLEQP
ncbi:MAG: family 78 glycoside hydrolase catalytic domain [Limisphaerales bacterium]